MKQNSKKETVGFSFSYLDVFFLLIFGLVLSVLLYLFLDAPGVWKKENTYQLEVSAYVEQEISHSIPEETEILFDKEGNKIGKILSAETEELGNRVFCKICCRVTGSNFEKGEKFTLETKNFIHDMWIYSVVAQENL